MVGSVMDQQPTADYRPAAVPRRSRYFQLWLLLILPCGWACAGCHDRSGSLGVGPPRFDARKAAQQAMELYDVDGDALLSSAELEACPAIQQSLTLFDKDSDGQVSAEEFAGRVNDWVAEGSGMVAMRCLVTYNRGPLIDAQVELEPEPFFSDVLKPATGVTGGDGVAYISVGVADKPESFKDLPVVSPGLYKVRVTHPKLNLAARYNTATTLGCEVSQQTAYPHPPPVFKLKK